MPQNAAGPYRTRFANFPPRFIQSRERSKFRSRVEETAIPEISVWMNRVGTSGRFLPDPGAPGASGRAGSPSLFLSLALSAPLYRVRCT